MSRRINRSNDELKSSQEIDFDDKNQPKVDFNEELLPEFETLEAQDKQQYQHHVDNGEEAVKPKKRPRVKKTVNAEMPVVLQENKQAVNNDDISIQDSDEQKSSSDLLSSILKKVAPKKQATIENIQNLNVEQPLAWEQNWNIRLCSPVVVYGILIFLIVLSAMWSLKQTFNYRAEYRQYNELKKQEQKLDVDWGRMLIEKQTFGSSGQIATRATMQMGMFSPSGQQRIVMNMPQYSLEKKGNE